MQGLSRLHPDMLRILFQALKCHDRRSRHIDPNSQSESNMFYVDRSSTLLVTQQHHHKERQDYFICATKKKECHNQDVKTMKDTNREQRKRRLRL